MKKFFYWTFLILLFFASANAKQNHKKKLRFFCVDFHGAVSADVKYTLEKLGHEVVVWVVSTDGIGYSCFTHGRDDDKVKVINYHSWFKSEMTMYEDFYKTYKDYLNEFDGFIAAYNCSFALLYEKLNKPIIIVNAIRYEVPFTNKPELWESLNNFVKTGINKKKLFVIANNKADQKIFQTLYRLRHRIHSISMSLHQS